jgi:anti-sigma B factor antagonist
VNCSSPGDVSSAGLLSITTEEPGDIFVVRAAGEIDLSTAQALRLAVGEAVSTHDHVAVDLTEVTFLSAEGLSILVDAWQIACRRGVRLYLVAGHRAVLRPLELTRLADSFTIVDSVPDFRRRAV